MGMHAPQPFRSHAHGFVIILDGMAIGRFDSRHDAADAIKTLPSERDRRYAYVSHGDLCKCSRCWAT